MRCLITGIGGFAGYHLANHLLSRGEEVGGIAWPPGSWPRASFPQVPVRDVDVTNMDGVRDALTSFAPDAVFHLAGIANVKVAWDSARAALETNFIGTFNVLEAARTLPGRAPRVLVVGSAEEYGPVSPERQPIREDCELDPRNPYGVSKVAQEYLGKQYFRGLGLPVLMTRSFNHIGPRQAPIFVASSFARQIAEIEHGAREPRILVGNLDARRDFHDVRDTARAYADIVTSGELGEVYNVCSGAAEPISGILNGLLAATSCRVDVEVDPERYRPVDVPVFCGDRSKIEKHCGWRPRVPLSTTLRDLLDYWRAEIGAAGR